MSKRQSMRWKSSPLYFVVLTLLFRLHQSTFMQGQEIATLSAMTVNFAINNVYRLRRLLGLRMDGRRLGGSRI
jgi:hypothetical protein